MYFKYNLFVNENKIFEYRIISFIKKLKIYKDSYFY